MPVLGPDGGASKPRPRPKSRYPDTGGWAGTSAAKSITRAQESRNTPEKAAWQDAYNRNLRSLGPIQPGQNNAALATQMTAYGADQLAAAQQRVPMRRKQSGVSTGGGGYGGGGGGGGGGIDPAAAAQSQIDALAKLLSSGAYTAGPMTGQREAISGATAADQASASGAYNNLDTWLQQNQRNPYEGVQMLDARVSNAGNPYLESQGIQRMNEPGRNPEDVGARNAFQNVLSLLGAGQTSANQSRLAESQMGRTFAGQQIGAVDNAMLAQVAAKEYEAQQALNNEKRQALLQMMALVGQGGVMPDLSAFGIT